MALPAVHAGLGRTDGDSAAAALRAPATSAPVPGAGVRPGPPPLPVSAVSVQLQQLVHILASTHGVFNKNTCKEVFDGILPLEGSTAEAAARLRSCSRLLSGNPVPGIHQGADSLQRWSVQNCIRCWGKDGGLCTADAFGGERGVTGPGAVVMTYATPPSPHPPSPCPPLTLPPAHSSHTDPRRWAHPGEFGNVFSQQSLMHMWKTGAFHQSAHYIMQRPASNGTVDNVLGLTPAIALVLDSVRGKKEPSFITNGQFMHDQRSKVTTADGMNLQAPSDFMADECYEQVFGRLLGSGLRSYLFVEGDLGRKHLIAYIKKYHGRAAPYSQATLKALGLDHLDWRTDFHATNGGSMFELYIHGKISYIFLRPSTGSYVYDLYLHHGEFPVLCALKQMYNQYVLLNAMAGEKTEPFHSDSTLLAKMLNKDGAGEITTMLQRKGWLSTEAVYRTPQMNGGHASHATDDGKAPGVHEMKNGIDSMSSAERGVASHATDDGKAPGVHEMKGGGDSMSWAERSRLGGEAGGRANAVATADRLQVPSLPPSVSCRFSLNKQWGPWSPPASVWKTCTWLADELSKLEDAPFKAGNGDVPSWGWFVQRVGGKPGEDEEACRRLRMALLRATQASPVTVQETGGHVQFYQVNEPPPPPPRKKVPPPSKPTPPPKSAAPPPAREQSAKRQRS